MIRLTMTGNMALLYAVLAASSQADTPLFDNGVALSAIQGGYVSDVETTNYGGDDFVLSSTSGIREIRWTGIYIGQGGDQMAPAVDDFTIRFFDYGSSAPNPLPFVTHNVGNAVNRSPSGRTIFFIPIYEFSTQIPEETLGPGRYLLSIVNDTRNDPGDFFNWSTVTDGNGTFFRNDFDVSVNPWQPSAGSGNSGAGSFDFKLFGVLIPEPTSLILCSIAGMCLAIMRAYR